MKKIAFVFTFLLICACASPLRAQMRTAWFVITPTYSAKIANVPLGVTAPDGTKLDVCRRYKGFKTFINDIKDGKGLCIGDFRTGLNFTVLFPRAYMGLRLGCNYSNSGFRMKYPGEEEYTRHNARGVSPELALRFTIGDPSRICHLLLELGAAYTYNFSYKGSFDNSKDIVGNGTTGIFGIGFDFNPGFEGTISNNTTYVSSSSDRLYTSLTLEYRYDFYNYFNPSYTPDGITYPYKDFKSKRGGIYFNFLIGIKL